jgi:hypothetical protein
MVMFAIRDDIHICTHKERIKSSVEREWLLICVCSEADVIERGGHE